jgi:hypothetical protein
MHRPAPASSGNQQQQHFVACVTVPCTLHKTHDSPHLQSVPAGLLLWKQPKRGSATSSWPQHSCSGRRMPRRSSATTTKSFDRARLAISTLVSVLTPSQAGAPSTGSILHPLPAAPAVVAGGGRRRQPHQQASNCKHTNTCRAALAAAPPTHTDLEFCPEVNSGHNGPRLVELLVTGVRH